MERLPHDYPWASDPVAGLLDAGRFEARERPLRDADLRDRRAVVAVGSNASPGVLAAKLPGSRVPFVPGVMLDVTIGHSAHVSLRGYIAASPYPSPGARTPIMVSWLGPAELAGLDATEPNYDRVTLASLGGSIECDPHLEPEDVDLYVSWHGVVRSAVPWPFRSQRDLFAALATDPAIAESFTGEAADVSRRLAADPDLRARITEHLHSPLAPGDPQS